MSHVNFITRNSTIDEWRIQTNVLANSFNNLETLDFQKSNGDLILSGNSKLIVLSNVSPSILVSNSVSILGNLFVGGTLTVNTLGVLETATIKNANITGNLVGTSLTLSANIIANNVTVNSNVICVLLTAQNVNTNTLIVGGQNYNNLPSSINAHTYSVVSSNLGLAYVAISSNTGNVFSAITSNVNAVYSNVYPAISSNLNSVYSNVFSAITSNVSSLQSQITSNVISINARIDSTNTYINGNFVTLGTTQTVSGSKTFSSTITGSITGNAGTVTNGVYTVGNQSIGGVKTFTAVQETRVNMNSPLTSTIDLSQGNYFIRTLTGTTTFTVANTPSSGTVGSFILDLTNAGGKTITFPTNTRWEVGTVPTFTNPGRDIVGFFTHDGGTNWNALFIAKDIR